VNVAEGDSILEIASGPGYLAIALAKRGYHQKDPFWQLPNKEGSGHKEKKEGTTGN
jgi:hypothetical protein